jgi:hypothetical protein
VKLDKNPFGEKTVKASGASGSALSWVTKSRQSDDPAAGSLQFICH